MPLLNSFICQYNSQVKIKLYNKGILCKKRFTTHGAIFQLFLIPVGYYYDTWFTIATGT